MSIATLARHRARPNKSSNSAAPKANPLSQRHVLIDSRKLAELKPHPRELRKHPDRQLALLAEGIREFGFINPIVIDDENVIIAGHARYAAAKRVGLENVNVVLAAHLTPVQKRAYRLADNKLAELSEWNTELLKVELTDLSALEMDFNVELTGFSTAEIDLIIEGPEEPDSTDDDELPPLKDAAVTRRGDLWQLGKHLLLCGDARDAASYRRLLGDEKARLIVTDPPYNVPVDGHVSGLGRTKHREFVMASGEMNQAQFTQFLASVFTQLAAHSVDGALHYHCMDHRHIEEMVAAGGEAYDERKNVLVWVKTNAGMGSFYRSQHELIFVYKHGSAPHVNNMQLGATGRYRTNVLEYAGANTFRSGRDDELARHPTPKPVPLIADLLRDASNIGDLVLDAFAGGGTIFVAAEKTRRRAAGIEIDPIYCDLSLERWQQLTGETAVLADTKQTFQEVAESRQQTSSVHEVASVGGDHGA